MHDIIDVAPLLKIIPLAQGAVGGVPPVREVLTRAIEVARVQVDVALGPMGIVQRPVGVV